MGKIVDAKKHPEADHLYIEQIDLGESTGPRTIVSGLAAFISLDQLIGKSVLVVTNLKASKFKGVESQGMVLAASNADKSVVEVLEAPDDSEPGDVVSFDGYESTPDAVLNPKHKVFEKVASFLKTTDACVATYKDVPFTTKNGVCVVKSIQNGTIG